MSDAESGQYTPTTEEVRDNMAFGLAVAIDVIPDQDHRDRANAVFDRWLAAHDAEVLASRDQEVAELRAVIEKVREAVVKYEAWLDRRLTGLRGDGGHRSRTSRATSAAERRRIERRKRPRPLRGVAGGLVCNYRKMCDSSIRVGRLMCRRSGVST